MELVGSKIAALTFLRALYAVVYWDPKERESEFNDAHAGSVYNKIPGKFIFVFG